MHALSLSPRMDLFVFKFPKDFLPDEIQQKYTKILSLNKSVITTPIDYLNESVQGCTFPGLSELLSTQEQHSTNRPETHKHQMGLPGKRVNIEPARTNNDYSPANILSQIAGEFKVTLRRNQGLYNYFMLYETIFHKALKEYYKENVDDIFEVHILDETGKIIGTVKLFQPKIDGIDGLEFSYNKLERQPDTFDITFKYNNIDFDLVEDAQKEEQ